MSSIMNLFILLVILLLIVNIECALEKKGQKRSTKIYKPGYHPAKKPRLARQHMLGRSNFSCHSLHIMLRKEQELSKLIAASMKTFELTVKKESEKGAEPQEIKGHREADYQLKVLRLFQEEVNASEEAFMVVLRGLQRTLNSDYHSLGNIRASCEQRLKETQSLALQVEKNHNTLHKLEKEAAVIQSQNSSTSKGFRMMNEILSEISAAADKLENNLKEAQFSDMVGVQGAGIETVLKVPEETGEKGKKGEIYDYGGQVVLIDSQSNRYTLSRPRDITVLVEDPHLVKDFVLLLVLSSVLGTICCLLGIPSLFGYVITGMIVGPAGYNLVKSVVQVETIGELGAVFIVFMAGLDFSLDKLRKTWKLSINGAVLLLLACVLMTISVAVPFGLGVRQSIFIASCFSLSSAPLVHQLLQLEEFSQHSRGQVIDSSRAVASGDEHDMLNALQGVLVSQDIQLGLHMALMPFFSDTSSSTFSLLFRFMQLVVGFILLLLFTRLLAQWGLEPAFKILSSVNGKPQSLLLGSLFICFLLLSGAMIVGASLELGCFLAGVAIGTQTGSIVKQIKVSVQTIREVFSIFFFSSIGFHVFPTFLVSEFFTISSVTILIVVFKLLVIITILAYCTRHCSRILIVAAAALAQVSEFTFILASRARRLNIVSREVYLVIVSVTALSIVLSPVLWRMPCKLTTSHRRYLQS